MSDELKTEMRDYLIGVNAARIRAERREISLRILLGLSVAELPSGRCAAISRIAKAGARYSLLACMAACQAVPAALGSSSNHFNIL